MNRQFLKKCTIRSGLAAMLAMLASFVVLVSGPVAAQNIVVNGISCPSATIQFTSAGMVAVLPPGPSCASAGNGNPCADALITYLSTGISIQAPASCASVPPNASPIALQTATVNGSPCNGATVTLTASGVSINAPSACLTVVPDPVISAINPVTAFAGQNVTLTGSNFSAGATVSVGGVAAAVLGSSTATSVSITVPSVAIGPQPVIVTVAGKPSVAFPMTITAVPAGQMALLAVQSRKSHGSPGTFNLSIDTREAIGGLVTVEPRSIGTGHVIVFKFDGAVNSPGTVSAVDSTGPLLGVSAQVSNNEVLVTLTNVTDGRRVNVSLIGASGVNGTANAAAALGFLFGDVNSSRAVNSSDIAGIKARSGETTTAANFRFDVNTSGAINPSDISAVKTRSGTVLQQ